MVLSELREGRLVDIYQLNSQHLFTPASLVKLASLSAFYKYFHPDDQFETQLLSSSKVIQNKLKGDLVLKGGGDPAFTSEEMWNLVNIFIRSGIKEVEGDIVIDASLYKPRSFSILTDRSYEAPISPASFNWNVVTFQLRPGQLGKSPKVFVDPENSYINVKNYIQTVSDKAQKINIKRRVKKNKEVFELRGRFSNQKKELTLFRNIRQPEKWIGYNLKAFLKRRGVKVKGEVKKGRDTNGKVLASLKSRVFFFSSYYFMKYSSNFIARMLSTHLPLKVGKKQGDFKEGVEMIRRHLKEDLKLKKFVLNEPSGLNRLNKFSPKDIQKILFHNYKHFYSSEMLSTLALANGQGTLETRYKKPLLLRAKTGYLSGVTGLSGILESKGKKYVFTFMYQGTQKKVLEVQKFFDGLLSSI